MSVSWSNSDFEASKPLYVRTYEAIAYAIIVINLSNLFLSRLGAIPDILQLGVSVPAFLWALNRGIDTRRIRLYLLVIMTLFGFYFVYSIIDLSYQGFRNSASLFAVAATFLFFFRASNGLLKSNGFLFALLFAFGSFVLLWESPYGVHKNNINGAMCYYLTMMLFCYTRLRRLDIHLVTLLFVSMFVLSVINGHRALAGASVLLLLQYYVLSLNVARVFLRRLMFFGLIGVVAGVVAVLVHPDLAVFAQAMNALVTGEGGRTLMSGRQVVWPIVWEAIVSHPVVGMGPGVAPTDLYFTNLSAHNLYLQVGLQIGYLGFALVGLLFWSLWRAARPMGLPTTRAAENLLTVIVTLVVVHSLFEVFLTQNALALGVPVWMALGLGLGKLAHEAAGVRSASKSIPRRAAGD